jgi:hypothetical protein
MKRKGKNSWKRRQEGAALLIAIFALLLISVVGIALLVSTSADTALAGNYRTATSAYYAGVAGLEEARGRLLWKNPDYINKTSGYSNLLLPSGVPAWCLTQVLYITNPAPGETAATYPDTEYGQEFTWGLGGANVNQIPSVSPVTSAGLPGPSYKWVRINPVTEWSLNVDVNGDGVRDASAVVYYDPAHLDASNKPAPSLVVSATPSCPPTPPTPTSLQALEITSLAVLPDGSRRLLQYIVTPLVIAPDAADQNFPGALTLAGNGVTFQAPGAPPFQINGQDGCLPPPAANYAIAYTNPGDYSSIWAQVNPDDEKDNYPGAPMSAPPPPYTPTYPSVVPPGSASSLLRASWLMPATLDSVVQDVTQSADVIINGSATGSDISMRAPGMSAASPMTIVVNGDLNLKGWRNAGYGLLLVTGTLYYDPDASWNGIVMVVGQGVFSSSKSGSGGINGTVFVATTRNGSGNLLPGNLLGAAFFGSQTGYGSNPGFGIVNNSCSINSAKGPLTYKILSFREIPQ